MTTNNEMQAFKNEGIYNEMYYESLKTRWPVVFSTDLTRHDLRRLSTDDSLTTFGWVLRETGTELLDLRMRRVDLKAYIEHYRRDGKDNKYYIAVNGRLTQHTFGTWVDRMNQLNWELATSEKEFARY